MAFWQDYFTFYYGVLEYVKLIFAPNFLWHIKKMFCNIKKKKQQLSIVNVKEQLR